MRHLVLTAACVFAAGSAFASSIEIVVPSESDNSSIAAVSCASCPPLVVKKKSAYIVPEVAKGTARVELKEVNGKMKLVRTEAWLGGSPVVFITSASDDDIKAAQAKNLPLPVVTGAMEANPADAGAQAAAVIAIDTSAKTSALGSISTKSIPSKTAGMASSREFDPADFELRLK